MNEHNTNTHRRALANALDVSSANYCEDPSPMNRARMFMAAQAVIDNELN